MGIPKTITQAMASEDSEFWKAAILDELSNHEEVFQSFDAPLPKEPGIKATPTRFLFSKKLVSLDERKQDPKSLAYKQLQNSPNYERFRARLLYVITIHILVNSHDGKYFLHQWSTRRR